MPREKTAWYWIVRIRELKAANPKAGAGAINKSLSKITERSDHPSIATIGRELARFRDLSPREQDAYREFHWPQSMGPDLVPWEASRVALDVLRWHRLQGWPRPSVQRVLWHWRLSLATPQTSIDYRQGLIMAATTPEGGVDLPPLDLELAFEPWLDEKREAFYNYAFPDRPWPKQNYGGPQTLDEILSATLFADETEGE